MVLANGNFIVLCENDWKSTTNEHCPGYKQCQSNNPVLQFLPLLLCRYDTRSVFVKT
jgi:hypothetical protein